MSANKKKTLKVGILRGVVVEGESKALADECTLSLSDANFLIGSGSACDLTTEEGKAQFAETKKAAKQKDK